MVDDEPKDLPTAATSVDLAEKGASSRRHRGRKAWIVGLTGNPGSRKEHPHDRLIELLRARNAKVAVVAVDPTSPFSGGAILGDRIRHAAARGDPKVFIRSLATRGRARRTVAIRA